MALEGRKSRLAQADEKLHSVMARSTFPSQNAKKTSISEHCWKLRCRESARAAVARSTCRSQKCKQLAVPEHFLKLRCWKSARRCGAKQKHTTFGPVLDVHDKAGHPSSLRGAHLGGASTLGGGFPPLSSKTCVIMCQQPFCFPVAHRRFH